MPEHTPVRHSRYLITHHPRFARAAIDEAHAVDPNVEVTPTSSPDITLIAGRRDLADAFRAENPIFVRHLAPVHISVPLTGQRRDIGLVAAAAIQLPFPCDDTFAVQCRKSRATASGRHDETEYTSRDIEIAVGMRFPNPFDPSQPQTIISIYVDKDRAYVGLSRAADNLTVYPDESRRPKAAPTIISRAEHKLREALEAFDVELIPDTDALDLGAAPGGWTYLLAEAGLNVVAVDPAELDPRVAAHPRVTHLRERARADHLTGHAFSFVTNDMAVDPHESAGVLIDLAPSLTPKTPVIMTVKLPTLRVARWLDEARRALKPFYDVVAIRHLFHNRQEVTALLRLANSRTSSG